jgi:uncharacterized membrane protein
MKRALQIILGISLFGVAFSGVLTYQEIFGQTAAVCPAPGAAGTVFGYPACVYGFFMYLIVAGTSAAGLVAARRSRLRKDGLGASVEAAIRGSQLEART